MEYRMILNSYVPRQLERRVVGGDDPAGRWAWEPVSRETPAVGDEVMYWQCGDDNREVFIMPASGGMITLQHVSRTPAFCAGTARFVQRSVDRFTRSYAIGDGPDSTAEYERVA